MNDVELGKISNNDKKNTFSKVPMWKSLTLESKYSYCIPLTIVILFIVVMITLGIIQYNIIFLENFAYIADAGSTGTRIYIYKWQNKRFREQSEIKGYKLCEGEKLTSFSPTSSSKLLECAKNQISNIPFTFKKKPVFYLCATGGMRILQHENATLAKLKFDQTKKALEKLGYNVKFSGVISGAEEGASGWLNINMLLKLITKSDTSRKTVGTMEMGGASLQITFENSIGNFFVDIFEKNYQLYDKSYLCYGINMMYLRYVSYVLGTKAETEMNCLLEGTPITIEKNVVYCRHKNGKNVDLKNVTKPIRPDLEKCKSQVIRLIGSDIQNVSLKKQKFKAVSSFYYFHMFLKQRLKYTGTLKSLQQKIGEFCKEKYEKAKAKYVNDKLYLYKYCLQGAFISVLFKKFGITESTYQNIEFIKEIKNQEISWTFGYLVIRTSEILPHIKYRIVYVHFTIVMIVLGVCLFCFLVWLLIVIGKCIFKNSHVSVQPINSCETYQ